MRDRTAELEQERVEAQSQVNIARASLNAAIGADVDRSFDLVTPLEGSSATPGSLETWIRQSLENRPDLERVEIEKDLGRGQEGESSTPSWCLSFRKLRYQFRRFQRNGR